MTDGAGRDEALLDGVLDSLEDMGMGGPLMEEGALKQAVKEGLASKAYTTLITTLCSELKSTLNLDEEVKPPQGLEDTEAMEAFQMELRGVLGELRCPHSDLTLDMSLLSSPSNRLLVLDYLVSEVLAARLSAVRKEREEDMEVDAGESHSIAANLTAIMKTYGFNKPPPNVTIKQVYQRIISKTREVLESCPEHYPGRGVVLQPLSGDQWNRLDQINQALTQEYSIRRQMLLTRCDVTIQSFGWSDHIKGNKEDALSREYQERRQRLCPTAPVTMAQVLAAKQDSLLSIRKTNDASVRANTQCDINKVLIGRVPDRGGRPRETRPPPEMPAFTKRVDAPRDQRQRGGGRGGGRGRGGNRVQGGWSGGGNKGGDWGRQMSYDYHGGGGTGNHGGKKGGDWGRQASYDGGGYYGNQQRGRGGKGKQYYS